MKRRNNPPFWRRVRASEKHDLYHATARENEKRAGGRGHAEIVADTIRFAIGAGLDQTPNTMY